MFQIHFIFLLSLPWICSIPLILLTNGIAALFFSSLQRRQEKQADEGALDFLQTNKGMIEFTNDELFQHLQRKHSSNEDLKTWYPEIPEDVIRSEITPTGNNRYDFSHPPLTERFAMALAFVPKAQVSQ
jgi:Zn-dependent protease with chaperone function